MKHDKEELEPLTLIQKSMSVINQQKGELAEFATELFFFLYLDPEYWLPFTYPKELTQMINQLKDGFLGRGASEDKDFIYRRNCELRTDKPLMEALKDSEYFEKFLMKSNLKTLMEALELFSENDKALRIIKEIRWRFDGLDNDYGMPRFTRLLGELKGTKFDYMIRKDGKPIIFESKYWTDSNKNLRLSRKKLKIYKKIRKLGISFYLMIYSIDREYLIQLDIDLISLEEYRGWIDKDLILRQSKRRIPKKLIESLRSILKPS
jgi:hypothetical protein